MQSVPKTGLFDTKPSSLWVSENPPSETVRKGFEAAFRSYRIVAFGKLGELCSEFLKKGRKVYLEGRLRSRSFTDNEGVQRAVTEIVLDDMVMLDSKVKEAAVDSEKPVPVV